MLISWGFRDTKYRLSFGSVPSEEMSLDILRFVALIGRPLPCGCLRDLSAMVRCGFYCPVQEQQQESSKLRARVAQVAIERGNLVAEVKASDSSLNAQTVRVASCCLALVVCSVQRGTVSCGGIGRVVTFRESSRLLFTGAGLTFDAE